MKITLTLLLLLTIQISANQVGYIKQLTGEVKIKRLKKTFIVKQNDKVYKNDIIITKKNSSVSITLTKGKIITLKEKSILAINKYFYKKNKLKKYLNMKL